MKRAFLLFLILSLAFLFLISCDLNVDGTEKEKESEPAIPEQEEGEETPYYSITGTWHYMNNGKDSYIQFNPDGTGLIHYYQYYGSSGGNLNSYVSAIIKRWTYYTESGSLVITIAGNNIGGINTDRGLFRYVVSELTETTLYITTDGAYDSAVPTKKTLTRGK